MSAWAQLLQARQLLEFPDGNDKNDTVFDGVHFNLTTLRHWNYTYYANHTVSNGSRCYLTYMPYIGPAVLEDNGTWVNATKCWSAVNNIGSRGNTGIALAAAFGVGLVLTLTALAKHGRMYITPDRRFYPIGRRWQWYWGCFVCAAALISLLVNIDVDRYYLQELPIIVTVFFWFLLCNGTTALVWEAVRHWGSWQERQYVDPNPFVYSQDDARSQVEFWMPLVFYFFNWLNFFMVVPRNWNYLKAQSDERQIKEIAIPNALSGRFKAAAFCLFVAWLVICASLWHSIKWYKDPRAGFFRKPFDFIRSIPLRLLLLLILSLGTIAYQAFISWEWEYSIMRFNGIVPVIYGWGYGPALLIIYIQVLYGFFSPNEDRELLRQRRERGEILDRELGIVHKPAWWARVRGDHLLSLRDKILRNVHEVGTERGTGRRVETDAERDARLEALGAAINDDGFELSPLNPNNPRVDRAGARGFHPDREESEHRPPSYRTDSHNGDLLDGDRPRPGATIEFPNYAAQAHAERVRWLQEDGPIREAMPHQPSTTTNVPDPAAQAFAERVRWLQEDGPAPPPYSDQERSRGRADRRASSSTNGSVSNAQPQQVRSMLDL